MHRAGIARANHERTARRKGDIRVRLHFPLHRAIAIDHDPHPGAANGAYFGGWSR